MNRTYVKKSLAVAVILLFISVSVIPSTGNMVSNDDTHCFDLFNNRNDFTAYGYCLNDTGELVEGPVTFSIEDPENITQLWATSSSSPMIGGAWTWDGWYCCEYGSGDLWMIDWDSGYMIEIGGGGVHLNGLTWCSDDWILGSSNTSLYKIDEDTGEQTLIGSFDLPEGRRMGGIGYDYYDNILYGIEYVKNDLYKIDIETGEAGRIGPLGIEINGVSEFDMAPFDDFNFYLSTFTTQGELYKIDTEIGECTLIGEFQDGAEISAITIPDRYYQPTANFSWSPQNPHAGEAVAFNASSSQGYHCEITLYEWDWDNDLIFDEKSTNPIISHMWADEGFYPVTLLVHDDVNRTDTQNYIVRIYHIFYVGGSGPNNYTRIQDAIDDASDGDTVFVYDDSAPYYENLVVNKSITLIGEDKNTTIIDGTGTGDVLHLSANNISIKWFTIKNGGDWTRDAGIDIRSNSALIKSNILIDNRVGIYLDNADYNVVMDNIIVNSSEYGHYSGHGIWLSHSSNNNTVTNNTISNGDYHGIAIAYSQDNNISQNTIINNEEGINLYEAANNILYLNDITNHSRCAIRIIYSGNDSIIGNNIVDNGDYGIEILGSNRTTIYGNHITNNYYAIRIRPSSYDINIANNTIIDCYGGIRVDDSSNLTINKNYIKNCTSNGISIYGSMWNGIGHVISENTIEYNGDEGLMLACDTPHNIISGNTFISNHPGITIGRDTYDNIIFENNLIDNYDYGILILPTAKTNYIYHNNFINNSKHAYGGTYNIWDDDYPSGGNYWDNYTGTDTNGDGIGDTPYYVPVDNEDHYPFMEPSGWDENYPPYMINLSGPEYGKPGIEYHYLAKFYDINSDSFYCMFDWGDESYSAWLGPYHSGETIHAHHAWINGVYSIRVKAKDILGAEGEWSDPLELHIEDDAPQVKITKPVKALYIMNRKILPRFFRRTLILGTIDVTVDAIDDSGIEKVEFYIDNKLKSIDNSSPYSYTWTRDRLRFIHLYRLKVVAYDKAGNSVSDKIIVRKFL